MVSVFDRFPERKARAEARAARQAELLANERRIAELDSEIDDAESVAPKTKLAAMAAVLIRGGKVDPESADGLREQRDKLRDRNLVLREALAIDDKWLEDFDNKHSGELCAERRPEFEKLYHDYFAAWVSRARITMKLADAHQRNVADGITAHQAYLPQLVFGSGPVGYGRDDIGYTESAICIAIREAVKHGYLSGKEPFLVGVNWSRN